MSSTRARSTARAAALAVALVLGPTAALLPAAAGWSAASAAPSEPSTPPSASAPSEEDDDESTPAVTLTLSDLAPAVAQAGDTLVLTGTITNTTDTDFVDPTLRIAVQQAVPSTIAAMERWFDPVGGPGGRTVVTTAYGVTVPAGASAPFSYSVAVADLGFPIRYDNWGARGLQVALTGEDATAIARTMGVFHPGEDTEEPMLEPDLEVSVLLPLTPSAQEWTASIETGAPVEEVAGDRIRDVVEATGAAASWALDPALLEPATTPTSTGATGVGADTETGAGATETGATDPADPTTPAAPADPDPAAPADPDPAAPTDPEPTDPTDPAPSLQDALVAAAGDRDIVALPWADADIPALAGTGADGRTLLSEARVDALEVFAGSGLQVGTTTAWPASPGASQESLALAAGAGYSAVVLDGVAQPDDSLTATPSARTDVTSGAATAPALVAEQRLSAALSGEVPPSSDTMTPQLASRQYTLALSAVMTRQSTQARSVLATASRETVGEIGTPDGQDAAALGDRVTSLLSAPWVSAIGVDDAFARTPDAADADARAPLPDQDDVTSPAFRRSAAVVLEDLAVTTGLRGALERPEALDAVDAILATATSSAWRLGDVSPTMATDAADAALAPFATAVTVAVPSSIVDQLAEESSVPLTLTNTLDQRLTVDLRVTPEQPTLRVEDVDPVVIEPGDSVRVLIPMVAVANGQTLVDVDVLSPDGAPLGAGETFELRVRAEWESVGTGIIAAALGVLLVVGLVRTVRRGRRGSDGNVPEATS